MLNPGDVIAFLGSGTIYKETGKYEAAIPDLDAALWPNPGDVNAARLRSTAMTRREQPPLLDCSDAVASRAD